MRPCDFTGKHVVIWGTGIEGRAAADFIFTRSRPASMVFIDEAAGMPATLTLSQVVLPIVRSEAEIDRTLGTADVLVKSPGVSLYKPKIQAFAARGFPVTSLLNLWLEEAEGAKIIGITGSKGKSTTAALLTHVLLTLGEKAKLVGNIGTPVTQTHANETSYVIVEVSSYQAATLTKKFDIGVVTSLFPEHLDWHGSLYVYYADKLKLLAHSLTRIASSQTIAAAAEQNLSLSVDTSFMSPDGLYGDGPTVCNGQTVLGRLAHTYLTHEHNMRNVCAVLTVIHALGKDMTAALKAMESFQSLPHRLQELGEKAGHLYVDDSLSTTPQSAIAAMEAYADRPLTLIAGGQDRGVDYTPLVRYLKDHPALAVVCMGPSGQRLLNALGHTETRTFAQTIEEAVSWAHAHTRTGGVVLLSPAAPSFGLFKNYIERGAMFAKAAGF